MEGEVSPCSHARLETCVSRDALTNKPDSGTQVLFDELAIISAGPLGATAGGDGHLPRITT
jgi:hypothetical protein